MKIPHSALLIVTQKADQVMLNRKKEFNKFKKYIRMLLLRKEEQVKLTIVFQIIRLK